MAAQGNAHRIRDPERDISALEGNPRERAPMTIDIDRTSVMWDLPSDIRKLTSVGDSVDRVHLQALLTNIFQRLSSVELALVQLSEQSSRIEDLEKNLRNHVGDDRQHSKT